MVDTLKRVQDVENNVVVTRCIAQNPEEEEEEAEAEESPGRSDGP